MTLLARLARLGDEGGRAVLFTVVEGDGVGAKSLVVEGAETLGDGVPAWATGQFDELVRRGRNRLLEEDGAKVFAEWYGPPPRLLVYGAVDTAEALARGAKLLGWTAIVADARATFLTPERIPSADRLIAEWPDEAIAEVAPDHQTAIVVLTHDDKFDEPALLAALRTDAFYIGALGSRRNQERRRERLLEAGATEAELARISGPCGLDIGADSQAETALSILAEALAARAGRGRRPVAPGEAADPRRSLVGRGLSPSSAPARAETAAAATAAAPAARRAPTCPAATPRARRLPRAAAASASPRLPGARARTR